MIRRAGIACCLIVLGSGFALTAANVVTGSRVGAARAALTANQLKPPECAALDLAQIRIGGRGGGAQNTLVLGTAGNDRLTGGNGNDCLVGGAGNDFLRGRRGTDVCLGGPGFDVFTLSCETRIQ